MSQKERHPPGLYVLFFTEMWERFGFYTMLALFTLYLKNPKQGFSWTAADATSLYSWYLMFVYASPLVGGWIADKKLGYRNSVLIGGLIFMVGYFLFLLPSIWAVYAALACLVVGNGFFKPNVSAMVGQLYPEGSVLKERAYNIFYMGINIGAFLAPLIAEFMRGQFGFKAAFAVAGVGMIISVGILWVFRRYVVDPRRAPAEPQAVADTAAVTEDAPPSGVSHQSPMEAVPEWERVRALLVIFAIVIVFWMVFHQNGSTLTYWADDNTDWQFSGTIANAINPFWVVTLTFPLVWFWGVLNRRKMEPSTPAKMGIGMTLTAVCFFFLYAAARVGETAEVNPETFPRADFRLTERAVNELAAEGVPQEILTKLSTAKGADGKLLVLNRKFSPDTSLSDALESVKLEVRSKVAPDAAPADAWYKLDDAKVKEDGALDGGKFATSLGAVVADMRSQGVPDDILSTMEQSRDMTFTGEAKFLHAVTGVIGPEDAARYGPQLLKRSYLFKVSPWWLIIAYFIVTLGELMLSPMGLALVAKVAPARMRGLMMGGWFVATAIGNKLTYIGVLWDVWLQSTFFAMLGVMALVMAVVLFALLRPLKKAMPGV